MEIAIVSKFYLFVVRGKGKKDGWGGGRQNGETIPSRCSALQKVRKSNASESKCIQPDGPARNSPLQEAKHVPFFAIGNGKKS